MAHASLSRFFILPTSILVLFAVHACTPSDQPGPVSALTLSSGLMANPPTPPPSFAGIIPGTTTQEQLWEILEAQGISLNCRDGAGTVSCSNSLFFSLNPESEIIEAIGYPPAQSTTLLEVMSQYGPPSLVQVIQDGAPETQRSLAFVYFEGIHTRLTLPPEKGSIYAIAASTPIDHITYLSDWLYQEITTGAVTPWSGFAQYAQTLP